MYDSPIKFYTSNFNFCVKMGINGPLYREIKALGLKAAKAKAKA